MTFMNRKGRLLCSPRDPAREAQTWLAPFVKLEFTDHKDHKDNKDNKDQTQSVSKQAYILGLGAAHHVIAAAQANLWKKITVLEFDQQTIRDTLSVNSIPASVEIIAIKPDFQFSSRVKSAQDLDYIVMPFKPAWALFEKQYFQLWLSLAGLKASESRTVARNLKMLELDSFLASAPTLLSSEDFQLKSILLHQNKSREDFYFKILKELTQ